VVRVYYKKRTRNLRYSQYLYKQNTHPGTTTNQGRMRAKGTSNYRAQSRDRNDMTIPIG